MQIFALRRQAETRCSTWSNLHSPAGTIICQILERGAGNPDHQRIPAGIYEISHKALGDSHFDDAFGNLIGASYKGVLWLPAVPGRSNIEIHTANFVEQLLGCLATGDGTGHDKDGNFSIPGGTSLPAYKRIYPVILSAINAGGARLQINDITA